MTGDSGGRTCPRCGRPSLNAETALCAECCAQLVSDAETLGSGLKIRVSPIISDALSGAQPGEDLDESLLRALKARHPNEAASLLPALTRMIELETRNHNEGKQQAMEWLAAADPGPEITVRTSGGASPILTTVTKRQVIKVNGKEYGSLDDVPPEVRRMIQEGMTGGGQRRVGCSVGALLALVSALARRL